MHKRKKFKNIISDSDSSEHYKIAIRPWKTAYCGIFFYISACFFKHGYQIITNQNKRSKYQVTF